MARDTLFTKMPASNYSIWSKWGQELHQQDYNCDKAACDALLFQCPDKIWRSKILRDKMDFQTALDWGISNIVATEQGKQLDSSKDGKRPTSVMPVDRIQGQPVRQTQPLAGHQNLQGRISLHAQPQ